MPYFVEQELKTLALPSNKEYWVKVQDKLLYGDIKKFVTENGEIGASADLFLETVIKEWNLDDKDGAVVPITKENIDKLTKEDVVFIIGETGGAVSDESAKKN